MESSKSSALNTALRHNVQEDKEGTKGVQKYSCYRIVFSFNEPVLATCLYYTGDNERANFLFSHCFKHSSVRSHIASYKAVQDVDYPAVPPNSSEFKEPLV